MASSALEAKITKIRQQNEEIRRRYEEVEEDKKNAAKLNALVQMVPSTDWPERKEPPEFANPPRIKQNKPTKEKHEYISQLYPAEGKKVHSFAQGEGPPPDPKYNFLADSEREETGTEHARENVVNKIQSKITRGNFKKKMVGREGIQRDNKIHKGNHRDEYQPGYDAWRAERNRIDEDRISRQRTAEGNWRREWDNNKMHAAEDASRTRPTLGDFAKKDHKDFDRRYYTNGNDHANHNRGGNHRPHRGSSKNFHGNYDNRSHNTYEQHRHSAPMLVKVPLSPTSEDRTVLATDKNLNVSLNQGNGAKGPVMSVKVNSTCIAGTGRVGPRQRTRVTYSHSDAEIATPEIESFSRQKSFDEKPKGAYFNSQKSLNLKRSHSQKKKEIGSKSPYLPRKEINREETGTKSQKHCEKEVKSCPQKDTQNPQPSSKSPRLLKKRIKPWTIIALEQEFVEKEDDVGILSKMSENLIEEGLKKSDGYSNEDFFEQCWENMIEETDAPKEPLQYFDQFGNATREFLLQCCENMLEDEQCRKSDEYSREDFLEQCYENDVEGVDHDSHKDIFTDEVDNSVQNLKKEVLSKPEENLIEEGTTSDSILDAHESKEDNILENNENISKISQSVSHDIKEEVVHKSVENLIGGTTLGSILDAREIKEDNIVENNENTSKILESTSSDIKEVIHKPVENLIKESANSESNFDANEIKEDNIVENNENTSRILQSISPDITEVVHKPIENLTEEGTTSGSILDANEIKEDNIVGNNENTSKISESISPDIKKDVHKTVENLIGEDAISDSNLDANELEEDKIVENNENISRSSEPISADIEEHLVETEQHNIENVIESIPEEITEDIVKTILKEETLELPLASLAITECLEQMTKDTTEENTDKSIEIVPTPVEEDSQEKCNLSSDESTLKDAQLKVIPVSESFNVLHGHTEL